MPPVNLPFSKGLITDDSEVDWLDALPVNMIAVPKAVLGHPGYMRSWPGLASGISTNGPARGAVNNVNDGIVYRIQGSELVNEEGTVLADVAGLGHAAMPYSGLTQAIVSADQLRYWDGSTLTTLQNWAADEHGMGDPATTFDLGQVTDAVYINGRYNWTRRGSGIWGTTGLTAEGAVFEQRPDYLAPFYSAESGFDDNIGISDWRQNIVIFGRYTTEFFTPTGLTEPIYRPNRTLTVQAGIVGVGAKCKFQDNFAVVGGPVDEPVSVYLLAQGTYVELATRRIQKILRNYTDAELLSTYIEPVKFDAHDGFIIHLPRDVLFYDVAASSELEQRWSVLRSGIGMPIPYRGIYHIHARGNWTAGDKQNGQVSNWTQTTGAHLGESVEYQLFTPMVQIRNRPVFDLQVDNIPGYIDSGVYRLGVAATRDGKIYANDLWIDFSKPLDRRTRVLTRKLGYIRNNIGFRLRWTTTAPSSVSKLQMRVE